MALGRRRYQKPSVFKTKGKRPEFFFRARVDVLISSGEARSTVRREQAYYVGYVDEIGKREAEKRRDEILGKVVNRPQSSIPSQVKFADVLKVYRRDHLAELRGTTQNTQSNILGKHFDKDLGGLRMCDIDVLTVQRWLSSMDLAYSTKAECLRLLKIIWARAEEWGFTQRSFPKSRYNLGVKRGVKGKQMPSMDQIRRLLAAMEDPYRAMAETALYTGLRISEIRGLKWEDFSGGALMIRRRVSQQGVVDVPKTESGIRTMDARPLAGVLARLPRNSEWVFGQASYSWLAAKMQAARESAEITIARFGWHHLRAACNTLMRSNGADSIDRRAVLGHSSDDVNAVYVHATPEDQKRRGDAMLAVQAAVMGDAGGWKQ
jgi:integrase